MDVQLKAVCEKFIADMSTSLTALLKDLLAKCDVIFQLAEKDRLDPANILHQQPFAKAGASAVYAMVQTVTITMYVSWFKLLNCHHNTIQNV